MVMNDTLLDLPAGQLVARMAAGELSPVDLVEAHVARAEAVDPLLGALVARRFEAARAEARAAEAQYLRARRTGEALPPLLGVPCTIKEFIRVQGLPYTAGIPARRGYVAQRDAVAVERLRRAGAIVIGAGNVPEGGMWMETHNRLAGRTNNPWNLRCTAGGSSGGDAALVSAGAATFALGSDVGGSVRIPAAFCGIVGHKPTGGLVPNTGHWPDDFGIGRFLTIGPLARSADDALRVLRAISGPDDTDPTCVASPVGRLEDVDLRDVVVYALEGDGVRRVRPEMRRAVQQASEALVAAGARRGHLPPDRLKQAFLIWSSMVTQAGAPKYGVLLGDGEPVAALRELGRMLVGRSEHTLPAMICVLLESLTALAAGSMAAGAESGRALRAELEAALGPNGVLVYPPYTRPAPLHLTALASPFDFLCTGIFNVLELPSTVVPMGFAGRLPVAVQLVGRRGRDHLTLAAAAALERAFGGWTRAEPCAPPPLPGALRGVARRLGARAQIRVQ